MESTVSEVSTADEEKPTFCQGNENADDLPG